MAHARPAASPSALERRAMWVRGQVVAFGSLSPRFKGNALRGMWLRDTRYGKLRNAAWLVRNSRLGAVTNPEALDLVLDEAEELIRHQGEALRDVLEAFAELLLHP